MRKLHDKTKLTIAAYNKNVGSFTNEFINYSPYAKQVSAFAERLVFFTKK